MPDIKVSQENLEKLANLFPSISCLESKLVYMSDEVKSEYAKIVEAVQDLFKDHWDEDNRIFDANHKMFSDIAETHGFSSIWSIYSVSDMNKPFQYVEALCYGKDRIILMKEVTWLDMWKAADELIKRSEDESHVFIEAFSKNDNSNMQIFNLETGS